MDKDIKAEIEAFNTEALNYFKQGKVNEAINVHKDILTKYKDYPYACEFACIKLSDIYIALTQYDLAEEYIQQAMSYNLVNPLYHYLRGFIYSARSQWDKAITEFKFILQQKPDDPEYLRGLGWAIWNSSGDYEGVEYLLKAYNLAPDNLTILTNLAEVYSFQNDYKKALEFAGLAIRIAPYNTIAQKILNEVRQLNQDEANYEIVSSSENSSIHKSKPNTSNIYLLKISLTKEPDIWRVIEIKGNQMLSTLHNAIFEAFKRFDEHPYSFFMSNKPFDKSSEYMSPDPVDYDLKTDATRIRINTLHLEAGHKFLYLFDYDDLLWHDIEVIGIKKEVPHGEYPRVIRTKG